MALGQATADNHWSHPWHAWYGHILQNNDRISRKCICFWVIIFIILGRHALGQQLLVAGISAVLYQRAHTLRHCNVPVHVSWQTTSDWRPGKKKDGYKKTGFLKWVCTGCRPPGPNSSQVCAVVSSGLI